MHSLQTGPALQSPLDPTIPSPREEGELREEGVWKKNLLLNNPHYVFRSQNAPIIVSLARNTAVEHYLNSDLQRGGFGTEKEEAEHKEQRPEQLFQLFRRME